MSRRLNLRLVLPAFALAGAAIMSACGVQGDLARPDPIWNREDAIRAECQRQAEANQPQDSRCAQYESAAEPAP
jgi:hypothetical protein